RSTGRRPAAQVVASVSSAPVTLFVRRHLVPMHPREKVAIGAFLFLLSGVSVYLCYIWVVLGPRWSGVLPWTIAIQILWSAVTVVCALRLRTGWAALWAMAGAPLAMVVTANLAPWGAF